jgi:hypothetical protein
VLLDLDHTLFVLEAKTSDISLENHVPQTVCEMYACAKQLRSVACSFHFPIINDNFTVEKTLFVELCLMAKTGFSLSLKWTLRAMVPYMLSLCNGLGS